MSATNTPQSKKGWLEFLSEIPSSILKTVRGAASRVSDFVQPHVVGAWTRPRPRGFVIAHPNFTIALIILVLGILLAPPVAKAIVRVLGFGKPGITVGSISAQIQSALYGGFVPPGSLFSFFQSFGAL